MSSSLHDSSYYSETKADRLKRWRGRLLDLSLNNRLIHQRERRTMLEIAAPLPARIEDELHMRPALLLAPKERHPTADEATLAAFRALEQGTLIINASERDLFERTTELYRVTQQLLADTGAAPLYLTLGVLRWYEDDNSTKERMAPLLLVPVTLVRDSVRGPFRLKLSEEDAQVNAAILLKLRDDFGIDPTGLDALPEDESGVDVTQVLDKIVEAVRPLPRFEVLPLVRIDLISFAKFVMWSDLEQNLATLESNPVVQRLLDPNAPALRQPGGFITPDSVEALVPAARDLSVVDADSTQLAAIHTALSGNSFIIQGPPGTGKSQTITNLIAQAVAAGKTVLFVAEKRAALDVVETRLKKVGLGAFTLEAHSEKASRAAIVQQLAEPMAMAGYRASSDWDKTAAELGELRIKLNEHAHRLNTRGPWGESLQQVMGRLLGLGEVPSLALGLTPTPSRELVESWRHILYELAQELAELGPPSEHMWHFTQPAPWTPGAQQRVMAALSQLRDVLVQTLDAWLMVASLWSGVVDDGRLESWSALAGLLLELPRGVTAPLLERSSDEVSQQLDLLEQALEERDVAVAEVDGALLPTIYKAPEVDIWRDQLMRWAHAFFLLRFIMLFSVRRAMRSHSRDVLPSEPELLVKLHHVHALRDHNKEIGALSSELRGIFEDRRELGRADIGRLRRAVVFAQAYQRHLAAHPLVAAERAALDAQLVGTGALLEQPVRTALAQLRDAPQRLDTARAAVDGLLSPRGVWLDGALRDRLSLVEGLLGDTGGLRAWASYCESVKRCEVLGLGQLLARLGRDELDHEELVPVFERALCEGWINHCFEVDPGLRTFKGVRHQVLVERFQKLDEEAQRVARREILARLASRLPDPNAAGQMDIIRRELRKKRGQIATRRLFAETRDVLLRLKPVILMSPLSVARNLDPSLPPFDLVIFDEASQIPPWDAIGAIARGRQVIVVGDSKQLPPTTFFQKEAGDEGEEDGVDMESILDQCAVAGMKEVLLGWHYRSRHESLIAFSNYHYYSNRLHIFPSPVHTSSRQGVKWCHVPDGFYDRGGSRQNRAEAAAVVASLVARVMDPATAHQSIGVVTFSMAQQRCVEDLLDQRRRDDRALDVALSQLSEPLFIKNLESVQGDERDVMLFSVGYGPDQHGRISMNFGPLNRDGGERRLNVAVTRARELLEVYSTLRADQLDVSRTEARGVQHLKAFLEYAEYGTQTLRSAATVDGEAEFESPFEADVAQRLEAAGWTLHRQVGVAGYRIDLAVVHPSASGAYMVGIECDGATYHSAATARDRDRLRQSVLERLGWRIHRIWSTDWWHDPRRILDDLHQKLHAWSLEPPVGIGGPQTKTAESKNAEPELAPEQEMLREPGASVISWPDDASPYKGLAGVAGGVAADFQSIAAGKIILDQIHEATSAGGPIALSHVTRHIARAWGVSVTSNVVKQVRKLVESSKLLELTKDETIFLVSQSRRGCFFYTNPDDPGDRDIDKLPMTERLAALDWIMKRSISLSEEEAIRELGRVFGATRLTKTLRAVGDETIAAAEASGLLTRRAGTLSVC